MTKKNDIFKTVREFRLKFPSKLYVCPRCNKLTTDPILCTICENQSNNFMFQEQTYTYTILETQQTQQIFKPLELLNDKGEQDGRTTDSRIFSR
jgi:hypothetical protein